MDPFELFSRSLDVMIIAAAPLALFGVHFHGQFQPDSQGKRKLLCVEVVSLVMIGLALFGLMR